MHPFILQASRLLIGATAALAPAQEPAGRVAPESPSEAAIRVRVVDGDGDPIPGAFVALRPMKDGHVEAAAGDLRLGQDWQRIEAPTDADGTPRIQVIGSGPWRVGAGAPPEFGLGFADPMESGGEVTITLRPLPRDRVLSGVLREPDGTPAERAQVLFVWDHRGRRRHLRALTGGDGGFILVTDAPNVKGALHANLLHYRFRSTAIERITTGADDLELYLGEPRYVTIEGHDQHGNVFSYYAKFAWQLAGHDYEDSRYPKPNPGEPGLYELPVVPFCVTVGVGKKYDAVRLGPFDPEEVGSKIEVDLHAYTRLRGRVMNEGDPVPRAQVTLRGVRPAPTLDVEMTVPARVGGGWSSTDTDGYFDIPLRSAGEYELLASQREVGDGILGPLPLDPEDPPSGIVIEIGRQAGAIAGRVHLPAGHEPDELWLSLSSSGGDYMRIGPGGEFRLTGLSAGLATVHVRQSFGKGPTSRPISNTVVQRARSQWFYMSHGPTRAPDWLTVEPTFDVDVPADEVAALDIDLTRVATCRLEGRIALNGSPPPHEPRKPGMYDQARPRVRLDRGSFDSYVSRCEIAEDGGFSLQADVPGTYRLRMEVPTEGDRDWILLDRVRLEPGVRSWEHDISTGSLRLLPREDQSVSLREQVRWAGPADLRIFMRRYRSNDDNTDEVLFPVVPTGAVQVFDDSGGGRTILFEPEIHAGEVTVIGRR